MVAFADAVSSSYILVLLLFVSIILCALPAIDGSSLSNQYEINVLNLLGQSSGYTIIFSLGVLLPILAITIILAVTFGIRRVLSITILNLLILTPEAITLHHQFYLQNIIVMDTVVRILVIAYLLVIINRVCYSQGTLLHKQKSTILVIFCGACSIILYNLSCYQSERSNEYFISYVIFSCFSVFTLGYKAFYCHASLTDSLQIESVKENRIKLCYTIGTCFVSIVYIVLSIMLRYAGDIAVWYASLAMCIRTCTVLAVFLMECLGLQDEEFARRLANECSQTEQTFVRLVSHEMRSPLNSIDMGLNIILDEMSIRGYSDEMMDTLEQIRSSCNFVVSILNNLVSAEMLEKGILRLTRTSLPAFQLVLDFVTPFFLKAQQAGVSLSLSPPRELMAIELKDKTLHGDKGKLRQMIDNLLLFAISKAPRTSTVTVLTKVFIGTIQDRSSSRRRWKRVKKFLKIDVFIPGDAVPVDEIKGILIDKSQQHQQQQQSSRKYEELWVCKCIVDLHDGEMSVAAQAQEDGDDSNSTGCTFTVILPFMSTGGNAGLAVSNMHLTPSEIDLSRKRTAAESKTICSRPSLSTKLPVSSLAQLAEVASDSVRRKPASAQFRPGNLVVPFENPSDDSSGGSSRSNVEGNRNGDGDNDEDRNGDGHDDEDRNGDGDNDEDRNGDGDNDEECNGDGHDDEGGNGDGHDDEDRNGDGDNDEECNGDGHDDEGGNGDGHDDEDRHIEGHTNDTDDRVVSGSVGTSPLAPVTPASPSTPMRYGDTVLVVDDSVINLKMLVRVVSKRCDRILEAKDGVEAVAAVQASMKSGVPVDLVLMDFQMPNMDGPTAASAMRKMGYKGPIIGVTGNAMAVDKELFISKGADKVLIKPINVNQVDFAVRGLQLNAVLSSREQR